MTLRIYGKETQFRALQTCLREQPLQATDIWTACRVRFHEQLGVTKGLRGRSVLDGRLVPLPKIATATGDVVFEAPLVGESMSASPTLLGEQATSSTTSYNMGEAPMKIETAGDRNTATTTQLAAKEELPDRLDFQAVTPESLRAEWHLPADADQGEPTTEAKGT